MELVILRVDQYVFAVVSCARSRAFLQFSLHSAVFDRHGVTAIRGMNAEHALGIENLSLYNNRGICGGNQKRK